jgi:hypothetical protein
MRKKGEGVRKNTNRGQGRATTHREGSGPVGGRHIKVTEDDGVECKRGTVNVKVKSD